MHVLKCRTSVNVNIDSLSCWLHFMLMDSQISILTFTFLFLLKDYDFGSLSSFLFCFDVKIYFHSRIRKQHEISEKNCG